jgi:small subunit ribosomal protein S5
MSKAILNRVKAGDLELKEKVVAINRVVKTTKGGRTFSFSALVVVGNENGVVGHGLGKAKEVQEAITKGIEDAKKNLIKVPVMHGTIPHDQLATIPHDQLAKEGAAKVLIKPAAHGTGVIAGGSMRAVLESAGVTDVLAKSLGSANPHNVVKATFKALALLREPINVAKTRRIGLKKVFNG